MITPFALGTMIGAIAARRVPVGNAAGSLLGSWTGALPIVIGVHCSCVSRELPCQRCTLDGRCGAAVAKAELETAFRRRALIAGVVAGAVAVAGLVVVNDDAHFLYRGLTDGDGLAAVIVSALAGGATLALVWVRRFELAPLSAAVAVATMIAGWALAQQPLLLPGLTIHQAAAGHDTLVAVIVAVIAGGVILFPSLALLFRLVLAGQLDAKANHRHWRGQADSDSQRLDRWDRDACSGGAVSRSDRPPHARRRVVGSRDRRYLPVWFCNRRLRRAGAVDSRYSRPRIQALVGDGARRTGDADASRQSRSRPVARAQLSVPNPTE